MSDAPRQMLLIYDDPSDQLVPCSTEESPDENTLYLEAVHNAIPYFGHMMLLTSSIVHLQSVVASPYKEKTKLAKDLLGATLFGNTPIKTLSEENHRETECGCQAYLRIRKLTELGSTEWRVTGFANHHNHQLLEPNQVRLLPAYSVSSQDVRNLLQSFKKLDPDDENIYFLRMCQSIKEKDPNFKFEFTLDANASSIQSYEIFGDAVVFDTTHRLSAVEMPLGIWVGVNNCGVPCFYEMKI
ncbi:FAR1 DNA binding domain [Arabidopsis suecica]|uniref:FAR1 DNA binding domain n=1 Tax=Arabidopsis suecica TaxID=45249 RepID=A0A8T2H3V4_ARASU|nr:FAR1 DNA binding domain [Arabidopsis suecica]